MKKAAVLFLVLILTGCAMIPGARAITADAYVEGTIFGGQPDGRILVKAEFDPEWITAGDNTAFDPKLAAFCALLCADSYFRDKDLARGTPNRVVLADRPEEEYDRTALLTRFGFSDIRVIETYQEQTWETDPNDSATLTLACTEADGKELFVVILRGCFSAGEWASAFDPGSTGPGYETLTGEHPEWTHPDNMKGYDIGANRAMGFIREYIDEHGDPEKSDLVLVTGHSRGGSLAGIIGAAFEEDPELTSCTYTFGAPPETTDPEAEQYSTVHNLILSVDFSTVFLPFSEEHFVRYGKDIPLVLSEHPEIRDKAEAMTGHTMGETLSEDDLKEYAALFGSQFSSRAILSNPGSRKNAYDTEEQAQAAAEQIRTAAGPDTGLDIGQFCSVDGPSREEDGQWTVSVTFTDAAFLLSCGRIMAYGQTAREAVRTVFGDDGELKEIADFLTGHGGQISSGHLILYPYLFCAFPSGMN